jgi:hypothetical protein
VARAVGVARVVGVALRATEKVCCGCCLFFIVALVALVGEDNTT